MRALLFLIDAIGSFFCVLFLLRFMMQLFRVSFAGQLGDFVVRLTDWAVKPLRRLIPGLAGVDWASLLAALACKLLVTLFVLMLFDAGLADPAALAGAALLGALLGLLRLAIYILIGALILHAVLSWVNPHSPLAYPLHQFTRPLLAPIQRIVPPVSGIDLSPLIALLLLQVVLMFL